MLPNTRFKTVQLAVVLAALALMAGLTGTTRHASAIAPASCSAILFGGGAVGDGMYTIDPAQNGSNVSVYCDMTTDGGGWTLAGYGASANLGGSLTVANGSYNAAVRTGSANIASVALAQGSTKVALSWSYGGTPTGNLGTYGEAVRYAIPNPAGQTLNPDGGGYQCAASQWTQVAVTPIVGTPNLPSSMYTRTTSLGASYGKAYGLVFSDGNPQCDWYIDNQSFTAVYLGIGTDYSHKGVVYQPGGESWHGTPNTMAIWFRGDAPPPPPVQTVTFYGGTLSGGSVGSVDDTTEWTSDLTTSIPGAPGTWNVNNPTYTWTGNANPTWHAAYLVGSHPWGFVPGTDSWINCGPHTQYSYGNATDCLNQSVVYRVRFTVPSGFSNPTLSFQIKADNAGTVFLNGTQVTSRFMSSGSSGVVSLSAALHTGVNEMLIVVEDWGGLAGFNYRADLSMNAPSPIVPLPPVPPVTPTTTTVSFGAGPFIYTGNPFTATATVSPAAAGAATIAYSGGCTNAGDTCTATATFAATSTYSGSSASANITITPAPSTTVVSGGGTFVYDGSGHPLTAMVTGAGGLSASVPVVDCVASPTDVADSCTGTATYAGDANHTSSSASATVTITKAPTTTSVSFGAGPFVYTGSAFTATASVTPAAAGTATIAYTGDCTNGGITCTATATYAESANYLGSGATANITITYSICAARGDDDEHDDHDGDRAKGHESGSTIPVKIRVCNVQGRSVGSRSLPVRAIGLSPSGTLNDSGHSNPGNLFRFDDGKYMFNLSTKGLAAGTYTLDYVVGNDPTVYHYSFVIRADKDHDDDHGKQGDDKKSEGKKDDGKGKKK